MKFFYGWRFLTVGLYWSPSSRTLLVFPFPFLCLRFHFPAKPFGKCQNCGHGPKAHKAVKNGSGGVLWRCSFDPLVGAACPCPRYAPEGR